MFQFITKIKGLVSVVLFFLFFLTLVLTPNDINSKIIFLLGLFSLHFFDFVRLKIYAGQHYVIIVLFLLICLSLIYTENIDTGLKKIERVASIPVSILIFSLFNITKKNTHYILWFFAAVVLLATLYSHGVTVLNFLENGETEFRSLFNLNYSYQALGDTLGLHPTYYSYFILTAIIILINFTKGKMKLTSKIFLFLVITYFSFFIIHLSSRISIITLYLIFIYNILLFAIKRKAILKSLLWLAVLHLLLVFTILNVGVTKYRFIHIFGYTYYTGYEVNDGNHKLKLWDAALDANHNFLFGNGMGDVDTSLWKEYAEADLEKAVQDRYNSHNQYIEYYVGLGIFGVLVFCYLLFYYAQIFYKEDNQIGFQFIAATAIVCLTECLFNRHHGVVFFVFMLGLFTALNQPKKNLDQLS